MKDSTIKRLFIANRGEIARRIAESAHRLGVETAAIHSGDRPPTFLQGYIDHWIAVPEETPQTYLNADRMVELARESKADALHPGFGFLSENADFARQVEQAGLIWIGPPAAAIEQMASKASARKIAADHEIPCVPGLQIADPEGSGTQKNSLGDIEGFAKEHGLPILLKAALGGGGKGMRVVDDITAIADQLQRAQSEALHAFGDGSLIVERYLAQPRHVEVQILADTKGHVITVGDRDCSLQRRHQKIIEEAPAPNLQTTTREAMHAAAQRLARAVDYRSAGTVEFLVEDRPDGTQKFYFLEMNTRLQVEHPVTEEVFQTDLVAWQLRIAEGESGPAQPPLTISGAHSVEARIYAEDPQKDFFPSPGPVFAFKPPQLSDVRWEPGIAAIDEISAQFDPMIAKVIATGGSRRQALGRLRGALAQTVFCGPPANLEFLQAMLNNRDFLEGPVSTFYLQDHLPAVLSQTADRKNRAMAQIEPIFDELHLNLQAIDLGQTSGHAAITRSCFQKDQDHELTFQLNEPLKAPQLRGTRVSLGAIQMMIAGKIDHHDLVRIQTPDYDTLWVLWNGLSLQKTWINESQASAFKKTLDAGSLLAPVPGRVVKIFVKAEDLVEEGQTLVILESMKMEFEVKSPANARIETLEVKEGGQVNADDLLIRLDAAT
jgi:acetyl/propionyl-CoA carboxylase alpha subunit